jgi:hypothetical protein
MTRRILLIPALVAAALTTGGLTPAVSHDDDRDHRGRRRLKADLSGFNEVLTVSTAARGSFRAVLNADETEISYRLDYRDLVGAVTQSHIHFGDHHMNGGISVWLCQTSTNPAPAGQAPPMCGTPGGSVAEAEGVITAANVIGPTGQGIAAGEFAELIRAIKGGRTYANVHSSAFPGGEIRGKIQVD